MQRVNIVHPLQQTGAKLTLIFAQRPWRQYSVAQSSEGGRHTGEIRSTVLTAEIGDASPLATPSARSVGRGRQPHSGLQAPGSTTSADTRPAGPGTTPASIATMRLVVARCTVDYQGRLQAHLPEAVRLLMVKADGSVAVHADGGAYKPLNWMNPPNRLVEDAAAEDAAAEDAAQGRWTVTNPKGETLTITLHEVISDTSVEMGRDPGLQKDGVEAHLQELLADDPTSINDGLRLVRREFPTSIGPVDLMCRDSDGVTVAVEVKRRGEIEGVEQLSRYLDFLNRDPALRPVRGVFVAQEIKPQAKVLAEDREIECVEVDYDELRGVESPNPRLF